MQTTIVRWLPWVLVAGALGVFLLIPDANGPVLVLVWGAIVAVFRYGVAILPDRGSRLWADSIFIFACLLAAFEGGWYLLPAALAFAFKDRAGTKPGRPSALRGQARRELRAGLAATAAGWAALAIVVWGPFYASRYATIGPGGAVDGPITATSLAAAGLTGRATVVLLVAAVLVGVIAVSAMVHVRTANPWAHHLLGMAILGVALFAVAGLFTIGAFLLPAVGFGILAWIAGRDGEHNSRVTPSDPHAKQNT